MPVNFLEGPVFARPDDARQIELIHALVAVHNNLDPVAADAHVGVSLGDFLNRWQCWL